MKILVTGGTGLVGTTAVQRLLDAGHTVRLLSRNAVEDAKVFNGPVEPVDGSVSSAEDLQGVAEACDVVIHNAGIVSETPPEQTFQMVNVGGTANIVHEAERAGVQKLIYISSLGADKGSSSYHKSKIDAEKIIKSFGKEWIILRPSAVFGPGDEVVSLLLKMVRTLPAIPVVAGGNQLSQPIWHEDLADVILQCVGRDDVARQIWLLGGPEKISMNEMLDRLTTITGKSPIRVPMPGWIAEQGAQLLTGMGIDLPFGVDQLQMLQEGNMVYSHEVNATTEVFGLRPVTLGERLSQLANEIPVQLPSEGVGDLQVRSFTRRISGSGLNGRQLFAAFVQDLPNIFSETPVEQDPEPLATSTVAEGSTMTLALPLRGNVQVRVGEQDETSLTLLTVEGHPLAGAVRFSVSDEEGTINFSVETFDRAANILDAATMSLGGRLAQGYTWETVLERVVRMSGGSAGETLHTDRALNRDDSKGVEEWIEKLVLQQRKAKLM